MRLRWERVVRIIAVEMRRGIKATFPRPILASMYMHTGSPNVSLADVERVHLPRNQSPNSHSRQIPDRPLGMSQSSYHPCVIVHESTLSNVRPSGCCGQWRSEGRITLASWLGERTTRGRLSGVGRGASLRILLDEKERERSRKDSPGRRLCMEIRWVRRWFIERIRA